MKADLVSLFAGEELRRPRLFHRRPAALALCERDLPHAAERPAAARAALPDHAADADRTGSSSSACCASIRPASACSIDYGRYRAAVTGLLREVLALQDRGDSAAADAFIARWSRWDDRLHGRIAANMRAQQRYRYRLFRYQALDDARPLGSRHRQAIREGQPCVSSCSENRCGLKLLAATLAILPLAAADGGLAQTPAPAARRRREARRADRRRHPRGPGRARRPDPALYGVPHRRLRGLERARPLDADHHPLRQHQPAPPRRRCRWATASRSASRPSPLGGRWSPHRRRARRHQGHGRQRVLPALHARRRPADLADRRAQPQRTQRLQP